MKEINDALRYRAETRERVEIEKIIQIKRVEGEVESKYL